VRRLSESELRGLKESLVRIVAYDHSLLNEDSKITDVPKIECVGWLQEEKEDYVFLVFLKRIGQRNAGKRIAIFKKAIIKIDPLIIASSSKENSCDFYSKKNEFKEVELSDKGVSIAPEEKLPKREQFLDVGKKESKESKVNGPMLLPEARSNIEDSPWEELEHTMRFAQNTGLSIREVLLLLAVVESIEKEEPVSTGKVERAYQELCQEIGFPMGKHTWVWRTLRKFEAKNLISTEKSGKGYRGQTTLIKLKNLNDLSLLKEIKRELIEFAQK